jgi:hypothetical protein
LARPFFRLDPSARKLARDDNEMELEATGRNVLIRRDPVVRSEGGLLFPDDSVYRTCLGTVVSVGSLVREVRVGDRVHYSPMGLLDFLFGDDPDLAVCTELGINAVIDEGGVAAGNLRNQAPPIATP